MLSSASGGTPPVWALVLTALVQFAFLAAGLYCGIVVIRAGRGNATPSDRRQASVGIALSGGSFVLMAAIAAVLIVRRVH
jgi:hypothetical protein